MNNITNPISPNYEVNTYYQLPYIDSFMSGAEWKVFTVIFNHFMICTKHDKEKTDGVEITHQWIMRKVSISERASINAIKSLKSLGILKSRRAYAKPNKYELNWNTINSLAKRQMEGENNPKVLTITNSNQKGTYNTAKNDSTNTAKNDSTNTAKNDSHIINDSNEPIKSLIKNNTPLQQTAENQTDGDENSNTQNEAIHNTNERTSGNLNDSLGALSNGDENNNTNSDKPKPNNQTAENQTDGYENSNNVDKANHNSNEHGIGNPSNGFGVLDSENGDKLDCDDNHNSNEQTKANRNSNEHGIGSPSDGLGISEMELELSMQAEAMQTAGITQPEVDIDQIPDIPSEPNEEILQQAYDWFNGIGDYDPKNLPDEEPTTPNNASEGLKAPRVDNYTQNPLDALKTSEKPQKSNPTTKTPIAEKQNTQHQSDYPNQKADGDENQNKPKAVVEELNPAHEKPQTPMNASEGLKTPETYNYTKTSEDALKTAKNPQKSNCTIEEEIDAVLDAPINTSETPEKEASKPRKRAWYIHPNDPLFWKRDNQKCREISNNPLLSKRAIDKIVEATVNRHTVISALMKLNSYLTTYRTEGDAVGICAGYWQCVLWYNDKTAEYSDEQLWLMYYKLKSVETKIKQLGFKREANAEYLDLINNDVNVNPKISEPNTKTKYTEKDFEEDDED